MTDAGPRQAAQRISDTLAKLEAHHEDVWVATAGEGSEGPRPHLVPLSLAWIDGCVVVALRSDSVTARNIAATGTARLALGPTRDVVVIDAVAVATVAVDADPELAARYAAQADWDPSGEPEGYCFIRLRPVRVQAWRESDELAGRTLMRRGEWVPPD